MRLLLARHGQTEWNLAHRYQGQTDTELTLFGEAQARCLGQRLAAERLDAVYTSDLRRAWRSAEIALEGRGLDVVRDSAWRELSYGIWEGLTRAEIAERFPGSLEQRKANRASIAPPSGESLAQVQRRVIRAVELLRSRHPDQTVLVVTHSCPLHVLRCWVTGGNVGGAFTTTANCGVSCLHWRTDHPAIEFWDDAAHLDIDNRFRAVAP